VNSTATSHLPTGEFTSSSPEQTHNFGFQLGSRLQGGEILLLSGPLGAGKTLFVKGICAALGIDEEDVTSPSFTLVNMWQNQAQYEMGEGEICGARQEDRGAERTAQSLAAG